MVSEEGAQHVQNSPHIAVEVGSPVIAFYNEIKTDIEHATVEDDPLRWGNARKTAILLIVSAGSLIAGLAVSIQNRMTVPSPGGQKTEMACAQLQMPKSRATYGRLR